MASERQAKNKRHNPVKSICRKIKTIQKRDQSSHPTIQMVRFHSRNFGTIYTNMAESFEETLNKMTVGHSCEPKAPFSSLEKVDVSDLQPLSSTSYLNSPEKATHIFTLQSPEEIFKSRAPTHKSLVKKRKLTSSNAFKDFSCGSDLITSTPNFHYISNQSPDLSWVARRLSLNEREPEWKLGIDVDKGSMIQNVSQICEEQLLTSIFYDCDKNHREGRVAVSKIMAYLKLIINWDSEDLEDLWSMFDPEKKDLFVDLETYHAVMKEWIAYCRNRWGRKTEMSPEEDSVYKAWGSQKSVKVTSDTVTITSGNCEAFGGDTCNDDLETTDLITYVADLQFNKQKLQEENNKFKLALEALEEANSQLTEDYHELHSQMKSAQQSIKRTNLLKEELEELKINLKVSEEEKTKIVTQNKQLERENQVLIFKIQNLQEENKRNVMDIDRMERKIEELTKSEIEHRMKLHICENTLLNKDASLHKKDLHIEDLKSILVEYSTAIESLRGEKKQLVHELKQSKQKLLLNGFNLHFNGQLYRGIPEGEKSLHSELRLAQFTEVSGSEWLYSSNNSPSLDDIMDKEKMVLLRETEQMGTEFTATLQKLHEEVSEVETLITASLQWVTDPEISMKERWEDKLTDLKHDLETKLNLCVLKLSLLGNYKESLDKEFIKVVENLKRSKQEYHRVEKELHFRKKQLDAIKRSQEDAVNEGDTLRKQLREAINLLENAEQQAEDQEQAFHAAKEKAESLQRKLEEAVSEEQDFQALNITLSNACQKPGQKTRKLKYYPYMNYLDGNLSRHDFLSTTGLIQEPLKEQVRLFCLKKFCTQKAGRNKPPLILELAGWYTPLLDALYLDSLTKTPRLNKANLSCISNRVHFSCESSDYGKVKDESSLDITPKGHKCSVISVGVQTTAYPVSTTMDDLCMKESPVHQLPPESLLQASEYLPSPPGHISSMNSTIASSDSSSGVLTVASDHLDSKLHFEKEEIAPSAPTRIANPGENLANEDIPLHISMDEKKTTLNLEAKEGPQAVTECKEEYAIGGETAASAIPVTSVKSVNFRQSDHISTNEKDVEAEFLRLSLGFKCDWFTLEKRVKLEERSRDLAEENLKKEITNCLKLLKSLVTLCEDDNQAQEIIKKLEKSLKFLNQCTTRVANKAEMLGAINQESRVSKAVEVMIQHVENLKRMYAKEHAELEELKQALLQNERPFRALENEDETQTKKRSASLNAKPSSLRRVSIATLPRNFGNTGLISGTEKNDRFSRRSSSWRTLGSKQSEHRPSLQHFKSTYSWADDEGEKCDSKDKEEPEPPAEEILEETRKLSLSEKKKNQSRWDVSSLYDIGATWACDLKTSFQKTNLTLWISVVFIVLFAAFMSFLTGRFFQRPVDAAPVEKGGSWTSLQQTLWPYTKLQHNGPPPV
ncbi:inositol 1,4,5-triphosphate receptor associated 2 [Notamacropus eugenii]|uniref:inositol 1,4,5-triphosphate receptor associated 2 n=1 Tax=Notamacropus eugenii TaxID=9315 RepID=UPI003B67E957